MAENKTKAKQKGRVSFNQDICKGCGLCVNACPIHILELDKSKINSKGYNPAHCINEEACIACQSCAMMCPDSVITVEKLG